MKPKLSFVAITGGLGFRLMAAFGIALMPLALLSYNQAQKFEDESQARWESALFGETLLAASFQIDAISRARGVAAALADTILPDINNPDRCTSVMQLLVSHETNFSFAGFIPPDGNMICASTGKPYSFAGNAGLKALLADPKPLMSVNQKGPISGESVLIFSHPVLGFNGQLLGFVSLSLPHRALEVRAVAPSPSDPSRIEPISLITFDGEGTILTATSGLGTATDRTPAHRPLAEFVSKKPLTFRDTVASGESRTFAVMAIVPGQLYVLGSWPATVTANSAFVSFLPLWVFPLAMWLASLLVAFLAAEHQILRHVRSLRQSIIAFAGGSRLVAPPDLSAAPNELRDVGVAYERMMSSVLHDAAAMENSMRQKEVLLREVHHRVKNNLQLIASIMNMQIRKSVNPEARVLLKNLHERVMSLATVHRELYQTSGLTEVRADELLESIVAQVLRMGATNDRQVKTKTSFDPIRLTPDQAVPLSLILTEALTNALKHGSTSSSANLGLSISLLQIAEDTARLEITNSLRDADDIPLPNSLESTGLGQQLLTAFASQLMGKLTVGAADGHYSVCLDFPLRETGPIETEDDSTTANT
jgi:two-component sensor histidine kinase